MPSDAEVGREIAHGGLQRRLRHAHDVVAGHPAGGAAEGQRQQRAARLHHLRGALGDLGEGEARDDHRVGEVLARRVGVASRQLAAVREGQRVHDEVEAAPLLLDLGEGVVDALEVGHVAIEDDVGARLLGERYGAPAERVALVGEGELGALTGEHPRDAPCDRALVGNSHDEAALACHQRPGPGNIRVRHDLLPIMLCAGRLGPTPKSSRPRHASRLRLSPRLPQAARGRSARALTRRIVSSPESHWCHRSRSCSTLHS